MGDLQATLDSVRDLVIDGSPHAVALGMRAVSLTPELAVAELPYSEKLIGDPKTRVIHGGAATALLDHVSGMAAFAALGGEAAPATLDLRIDYFRAAEPGKTLVAEARPRMATRVVAWIDALVHDGDRDDPVAVARAAFMVPEANVEQARAARAAREGGG